MGAFIEGIYGGKSSWLYVWKRYKYTPPVSISNPTFTGQIDSSNPNSIVITESSFDKGAITDIDFFAGFTTSDGTYHFDYVDSVLYYYWGTGSTQYRPVTEYDNTTYEIKTSNSPYTGTFNFSFNGTKIIQGIVGDFVDYVVANDESKYPDGGTQDGYWYERFDDALTDIDYGTITNTASSAATLTIEHNLGVVPSKAFLLTRQMVSGRTCFNIDDIVLYQTSSTALGFATQATTKTETSVTFTRRSSYPYYPSEFDWIVIA